MGIGNALYEEMMLDDKGKIMNPNFHDYRVPSMMEIPSGDNMQSIIVQAAHRDGPFGAKGIGEPTTIPTAPAIANAIAHAIGVRIKDLPITPDKILRALREKSKAEGQPGRG